MNNLHQLKKSGAPLLGLAKSICYLSCFFHLCDHTCYSIITVAYDVNILKKQLVMFFQTL